MFRGAGGIVSRSGKNVSRSDSSGSAAGPVNPPRPLLILYRSLLILALALGLCILGGTVYVMFRGTGAAVPENSAGQEGDAAGETVFTGIGRLRIPLAPLGDAGDGASGDSAGEGRAALVISIVFPYSPRDRAFSEELALRVGDFRRIAREYFSSRSVEELRAMDEETMKAGLLGAYNSALRLGKIRVLYFNDLLLFE
jgi:flagellar basal body-associated protein FliL